MPIPTRIARPRPSANTPYGARATIQCSSTVIEASTERNRSTSGSRNGRGIRLTPRANATVKTIIGTMAPSAADRIALVGTRLITHCAMVG